MDLQALEQLFDSVKSESDEGFRLRIHRSLSWYRASQVYAQQTDVDMSFIALWIGFNAAYANDLENGMSLTEKENVRHFLTQIYTYDDAQELSDLVWNIFSQSIRVLLDNPYVFQPFWDAQNAHSLRQDWQESFQQAREQAHQALSTGQTVEVLYIVFCRLYTLRNQLMHGGATFRSSANRSQLKDGCAILGKVLPIVLKVMMQHPHGYWGTPFYPYIKGAV